MRKLRWIFVLLMLVLPTLSAQAQDAPEVCGVSLNNSQDEELASEIALGTLVKPFGDHTIDVRSGPNRSASVLFTVESGILEVVGGPTTQGRIKWWEVLTRSGEEGWIAEEGPETLALGTALTEKVIAFNDGWCATHPQDVEPVRFNPNRFLSAPAWGLYFEDLPDGDLYFQDVKIPDEETNITQEADGSTLVRVRISWLMEQALQSADWRTGQFSLLHKPETED
jgi:hypothetical protein